MEINVHKLVNDADIFEILKLAYVLDKNAVVKAFKKVGYEITNLEDIKTLADLHQNGGDTAGVLKDEDGNSLYFNVAQVVLDAESKNFTEGFFTK